MYIDLMSPYNELTVNLKLVNVFNLQVAFYWAELMNIYARVINKKKDEMLKNDGYFDLDRSYIEKRTKITTDEQLACDSALQKLEIVSLDPNDSNRISIDMAKMFALILEDDPAVIRDLQKRAKLKRDDQSSIRREMIRRNLSVAINETDIDLLNALRAWVDALAEAKVHMTKAAVEIFQKNLNSYTDNKEVKLKIIEIAIVHAWADFAWAKNTYEKDYRKSNGTFIGVAQKSGKVGIDPNSGF